MRCQSISALLALGGGLLAMLLTTPLLAENWADRTQVNGFFSGRYSVTDEQEFLLASRDNDGINNDGSFYDTKLGINITSHVKDWVTLATLLFARDQENDFKVHAEWFFADFSLNDNFDVRAGKIKYPVGLVNEYVDVGVAYPWIQAPVVIYLDSRLGPQVTRDAYSGADLLWNLTAGDWTWGVDLFGGSVDLEQMMVKKAVGITGRVNWDDKVIFQASTYAGKMKTDTADPSLSPTMVATMAAMNSKQHEAYVAGVKVDWNDWLVYTEVAKVEMDFKTKEGVAAGDSDSWYATLGHQFGKWLLHLTYQKWSRDNNDGQRISTLGLNYRLDNNVVIKGEGSRIKTDGKGLFISTPSNDTTRLYSLAVNLSF